MSECSTSSIDVIQLDSATYSSWLRRHRSIQRMFQYRSRPHLAGQFGRIKSVTASKIQDCFAVKTFTLKILADEDFLHKFVTAGTNPKTNGGKILVMPPAPGLVFQPLFDRQILAHPFVKSAKFVAVQYGL